MIVFANISNIAESSSVLITGATGNKDDWATGAAKELAGIVPWRMKVAVL